MSTENQEQEEKKVPTKDEIIAFLREQIEVKKVQLELQELNTSLALNKAEELKALAFIGQITNPQPEKEEEEEPKARTLKKDK